MRRRSAKTSVQSFLGPLPTAALGTYLVLAISGCAELNARRLAREGNELYHAGEYQKAAELFEQAEQAYAEVPEIVLNHGLTCRQLIVPGSDSAESKKATDCALSAFKRLEKVAPQDERASRLYIQTLFDADRYQELSELYLGRYQKNSNDLEAVNALIQIYSRWDKWDEALKWTVKRADAEPSNVEYSYAVGVLIYNRLFAKGGGGDATRYDPRPDVEQQVLPPMFGSGDIAGQQRIELADLGLKFLQSAVDRRNNYQNAIVYLNLLYRQRSLAFLDEPEEWQRNIEKAESWRKQAQELLKAAVETETTQGTDKSAGEDG